MRRQELGEREWQLVAPHKRGRRGTGRDNRPFVHVGLYRVRTGCAGRELPERFGPWNTLARRFRRGAQAGVWEALFHRADFAQKHPPHPVPRRREPVCRPQPG
jgi:transposase